MLLQQDELLFQVFDFRTRVVKSRVVVHVDCALAETRIPMIDLGARVLRHVRDQELLEFVAQIRGPVAVADRAESRVLKRVLDIRKRVVL